MVNIARTFLVMLNNLQQMRLKLLKKKAIQKHQKQLEISLVIKLLTNFKSLQKIHDKAIQR